jgi:hypothetical protein
MSENEIHVGDVGTILRVIVEDDGAVINVSGTDSRTIYLKKPDGTKLTKTAVFTTDGSDGKIQYVTISGDLDTEGWWKIQGLVHWASGNQWYTDWQPFEVHDNL